MRENKENNVKTIDSIVPLIASSIMTGFCVIPFVSSNFGSIETLQNIGTTMSTVGITTLSGIFSYLTAKSFFNNEKESYSDEKEFCSNDKESCSDEKEYSHKVKEQFVIGVPLTKKNK